MNRYERATAFRQSILDFVISHPNTSSVEIVRNVPGVKLNNVNKALVRMETLGEIKETGIDRRGRVMRLWSACRDTCVPGEEIMHAMTVKMHTSQGRIPKIEPPEKVHESGFVEPGRYRNFAGSLPRGNSGGQGGCHKPRMCSRMMGR